MDKIVRNKKVEGQNLLILELTQRKGFTLLFRHFSDMDEVVTEWIIPSWVDIFVDEWSLALDAPGPGLESWLYRLYLGLTILLNSRQTTVCDHFRGHLTVLVVSYILVVIVAILRNNKVHYNISTVSAELMARRVDQILPESSNRTSHQSDKRILHASGNHSILLF